MIVTPHPYETIRETIRHLRVQNIKDRLEIVIVARSAAELDLDEVELRDFHQVQVVEFGPMRSRACAVAAGVRRAHSSLVAFAEDHSYPEPGWAEALIKAHREPWAAIGPSVRNANPESVISWADFLLGYASWLDPATPGATDRVPGHNSSYKRSILLGYGRDLEAMLAAEVILHWDLRARGYQLYLEPAAKVSHMNFERLSPMIRNQFHHSRLFAAARSRGWSPIRRMLYVGGAPLIPGIRFWRIIRGYRGGRRNPPLRVLPPLMLGLIVAAVGELVGYASGAADAEHKLFPFEFLRVKHLVDRSRHTGHD